jgi:hypothetical protein
MELDLNTLAKEEFLAYLAAHTYEEVEALYGTLDAPHEAERLRWCTAAISAFIHRKDSLTTILEIRDYVRELPTWFGRQKDIMRQVNELKQK